MDSLEEIPSDGSKPPTSLADSSPFRPASSTAKGLNGMPSPSSVITTPPITPFRGYKTPKSTPIAGLSVPQHDDIPHKEEPTTPERQPVSSTPLKSRELSAAPKKSSKKKLLKNQDIAACSPQLFTCEQKTDRKSQCGSPAG